MRKMIFLLMLMTMNAYARDIVINAVGDTMMGTLYPKKILPPENGAAIFKFVKQYLTNGNPDIVFANLEGSVTHYHKTWKNVKSGHAFAFQMPPEYIKYLKGAGFNLVSTANNHAYDFGLKGYRDTHKYLKKAGIDFVGNKRQVLVKHIDGKKVAFIGFAWGPKFNDILSIKASRKFIRQVVASNDIVILSMHGGSEGERAKHVKNKMEYLYGNRRGNLVRFTHMAIDAGVDVVIGHGPHLPRALQLYKGRLIIYSLGNFATYHMFVTSGVRKYSLIMQVRLNDDGSFRAGKIIPLIQFPNGKYRGIPKYDPKGRTIKYIKKMTMTDFPVQMLNIDDDGTITVKTNKKTGLKI